MATYVISDIHGCFYELQTMLDRIGLTEKDRLILAGDYIDRGSQSPEVMRWLLTRPANVVPIKGNHDAEFAEYVRLMQQVDLKNDLKTDPDSSEDAKLLLDCVLYLIKRQSAAWLLYFDYYGTVSDLIGHKKVTFGEMCRWADMIDELPYHEHFRARGRECVAVHAGYCEDETLIRGKYGSLNEFCLYARDDALEIGGIEGGMIIAGHTPTISNETRFYTGGRVFCHHDTDKDCIFYDIDCGCVFRSVYPSGTMACLRADDEEIFYL